jgi:hypothetical protein
VAKNSVPTLGYGVSYTAGNVFLALWGTVIVFQLGSRQRQQAGPSLRDERGTGQIQHRTPKRCKNATVIKNETGPQRAYVLNLTVLR